MAGDPPNALDIYYSKLRPEEAGVLAQLLNQFLQSLVDKGYFQCPPMLPPTPPPVDMALIIAAMQTVVQASITMGFTLSPGQTVTYILRVNGNQVGSYSTKADAQAAAQAAVTALFDQGGSGTVTIEVQVQVQ
jgi:hypothetical protein